MRTQVILKCTLTFSLILALAWGSNIALAQIPTVTLSTSATDPVHGPFSVTAQFSAPVTTFTASRLTLSNATATELKALTVQDPLSGGGKHNLALKTDGTVVAWGYNDYSQCNVPAGLSGVVAVAGGDSHSLALKADGTVVAWGWNVQGLCNVPADLSGVVAIAGGQYHSLALKADGTVVAWGDNFYGQKNVPAGLKVALPGLTYFSFTVKPYNYGPLSVQVPAGVVTSIGGVSNAASNILQFNSLVPVSLSRFRVE